MIPEHVLVRPGHMVEVVDGIYSRFEGGVWSSGFTSFNTDEFLAKLETELSSSLLGEPVERVITVESAQRNHLNPRPTSRLQIVSSTNHSCVVARDSSSATVIGGPNNRAFVQEVIQTLKLDLSQATRRDLTSWE